MLLFAIFFEKLPKSQHFCDIYDSLNVEHFHGGFMAKHNRRYKDSVFVDLFGEDKNAKANFLSLYNALHGTGLDASAKIEPLRLEQVMYMAFRNDIACIVDD